VLCEQFIDGDEVTCPCWARARARGLPVIRIVAPEGNYDYQNKYFTDVTEYRVPCGLPPGEAAIQRWCSRPTACWAAAAGAADVMIDAATASPSCWRSTPRPA
jgi:D-alanine-D-alanine ligase